MIAIIGQAVASFIFNKILSIVYSISKRILSIKHRFYKAFKTNAYIFIVAGFNKNIVCIGGPASNNVTEVFVKTINQDKFKWEFPYHQFVIEDTRVGGPRQSNYGIIIKGPNPFNRKSSLLIVAGLGDTGSAAAGKIAQKIAQGPKVKEMYKKVKRSTDDYIVTVVKGEVFEDHKNETWEMEQCEISKMITLKLPSEGSSKGIIKRIWEWIW